jgi:hypothetical protein
MNNPKENIKTHIRQFIFVVANIYNDIYSNINMSQR